MKVNRWIPLAGAAVVALLGAVGCGGGTSTEAAAKIKPLHPPRKLSITLDGYYSPENVGILTAWKRGFFEDLGIELGVFEPGSPSRPVPYVVEGEADLSIASIPQVALAEESGAPIVAVASVVPQSTAALIWLKKSKIGGIAGLKGKTIAFAGLSWEKSLLQSILARAGLSLDDVKVENLGYELTSALVGGRVDAIVGGSWNVEGIELEKRGLEPVVKRVRSLGVPPYEELVLIVRRDRLEGEPQTIRNFVAAMNRGTTAAIENPKAAADVIASAVNDPNQAAIKAELKATLPLLSRSGRMNSEQASGLLDWMREEGLAQHSPAASELLTNAYVGPSAGQ